MKLHNSRFGIRLIVSTLLLAGLAGCGAMGSGPRTAAVAPDVSDGRFGPAADYPMVVGDPFTVDGVTYEPADTLNFDKVGFAIADNTGGAGITGSHRELPLPSYVEVTSLETGRTVLVRLERRGPMVGDANVQIALSPGALEQLASPAGTAVRVRRVNPPEVERSALRQGQKVPARMDTPMSLVTVLMRQMPDGAAAPKQVAVAPRSEVVGGSLTPSPSVALPELPPAPAELTKAATLPVRPAPRAVETIEPEKSQVASATLSPPSLPPFTEVPAATQASVKSDDLAEAVVQAEAPASKPPSVVTAASASASTADIDGRFIVQAGAFSSKSRAERVAKVIGGVISQSGALYRVRTGPFISRDKAEASLAKVQAAGYRDARIFTNS